MSGVDRTTDYLTGLLAELRNLPRETEWVEFKENNNNPEEIGEYISGLSNSAALCGKTHGYVVWGIADKTHEVVGTDFRPGTAKKGNEDLESWLLRLLSPRIDFHFWPIDVAGQLIVLLEIPRASSKPVQFQGNRFIRVGSYLKKLKDFPERERELWRIFDRVPFEEIKAVERLPGKDVLALLDYPSYFDLLKLPLPDGAQKILERLSEERMVSINQAGGWDITNLGAVLFAHKVLKDMDRTDRIRACYLHACLRFVHRDPMTNSSLRERFGIVEHNAAIASRIIRDTMEENRIKAYNPEQGKKYAKYVPFWA